MSISTHENTQKSSYKSILQEIVTPHKFPSLHINKNSNHSLSSFTKSSFYHSRISFKKQNPQQIQQTKIRFLWRSMKKWHMFEDYLALRTRPKSIKTTTSLATENNDTTSQQSLHSQRGGENNILKSVMELLVSLNEMISKEQIEIIQPNFDKLLKLLVDFSNIHFYLCGAFINILVLEVILIQYIKLLKSYGKFRYAKQILKKLLRFCNQNKLVSLKLIFYKMNIKYLNSLQLFDKAMAYAKKMLKLALLLNDRNYELLAYDKISVLCYYVRDMNAANFFHNRFVTGDYEPQSSIIRQICEKSYRFKKQISVNADTDSEDDLDLELVIQKSNLQKWEQQQSKKNQTVKIYHGKSNSSLTISGYSFRRFQDNFKNSAALIQKIRKYDWNYHQKLGPEGNIQQTQLNYGGGYVSQLSPSRFVEHHLIQKEMADVREQGQVQTNLINQDLQYRNNIPKIQKLIQIFIFEIQFYLYHNYLFQDIDELL